MPASVTWSAEGLLIRPTRVNVAGEEQQQDQRQRGAAARRRKSRVMHAIEEVVTKTKVPDFSAVRLGSHRRMVDMQWVPSIRSVSKRKVCRAAAGEAGGSREAPAAQPEAQMISRDHRWYGNLAVAEDQFCGQSDVAAICAAGPVRRVQHDPAIGIRPGWHN